MNRRSNFTGRILRIFALVMAIALIIGSLAVFNAETPEELIAHDEATHTAILCEYCEQYYCSFEGCEYYAESCPSGCHVHGEDCTVCADGKCTCESGLCYTYSEAGVGEGEYILCEQCTDVHPVKHDEADPTHNAITCEYCAVQYCPFEGCEYYAESCPNGCHAHGESCTSCPDGDCTCGDNCYKDGAKCVQCPKNHSVKHDEADPAHNAITCEYCAVQYCPFEGCEYYLTSCPNECHVHGEDCSECPDGKCTCGDNCYTEDGAKCEQCADKHVDKHDESTHMAVTCEYCAAQYCPVEGCEYYAESCQNGCHAHSEDCTECADGKCTCGDNCYKDGAKCEQCADDHNIVIEIAPVSKSYYVIKGNEIETKIKIKLADEKFNGSIDYFVNDKSDNLTVIKSEYAEGYIIMKVKGDDYGNGSIEVYAKAKTDEYYKKAIVKVVVCEEPVNQLGITLDRADGKYKSGSDVTFSANAYESQKVRYTPVSWKVNPEGEWTQAPYTATVTGLKDGKYTVSVLYLKEVSIDGTNWETAGYTTVSKSFTVGDVKDGKASDGDTRKTGDVSNAAAWMMLVLGIAILGILGAEKVSQLWQAKSQKLMK